MIKTILYLVVTPLTLWALDSVNINKIFKKNKYYVSVLFYLLLTIALSYLVVNFFYDFYEHSAFIT